MKSTPLGPPPTLEGTSPRCRDLASVQAREQRYPDVSDLMIQGFALAEIMRDEQGQPCDFRVLEVNEACGHLTGFYPE